MISEIHGKESEDKPSPPLENNQRLIDILNWCKVRAARAYTDYLKDELRKPENAVFREGQYMNEVRQLIDSGIISDNEIYVLFWVAQSELSLEEHHPHLKDERLLTTKTYE